MSINSVIVQSISCGFMTFYRITPDNNGTFIVGTITFCTYNGIKTKLIASRNPKNKREMIRSGAVATLSLYTSNCWCCFHELFIKNRVRSLIKHHIIDKLTCFMAHL